MTDKINPPEPPEEEALPFTPFSHRLKRQGVALFRRYALGLKWPRIADEIRYRHRVIGFGRNRKSFTKHPSHSPDAETQTPGCAKAFFFTGFQNGKRDSAKEFPQPPSFEVAEEKNRPTSPPLGLPEEMSAFRREPASEFITPTDRPPPAVERSSHMVLDQRSRRFVADLLDIQIPSVKIYANTAAHALTKKYKADALTFGNKILFRAGHFTPHTVRGMALLGHELTHAAQNKKRGPGGFDASVQKDHQSQELEALRNERRILNYASERDCFSHPSQSDTPSDPFPLGALPTLRDGVHRSPPPSFPMQGQFVDTGPIPQSQKHGDRAIQTLQPQAAVSSRNVGRPVEPDVPPTASPSLTHRQLDDLKEEVYRDLIQRIRTEFERGG